MPIRTIASLAAGILLSSATSSAVPRSLELEKLTWREVRDAMEDGYRRVLVAVGSTEQHGPAIALGSDSFQGEELGRRVAERLGHTLLAPVIRIGVAPHHMHFAGTLTVREEILVELLLDHARSLTAHGFEVLLLPTHGGNFGAVAKAVARARDEVPGRVIGFSDAAAYLGAMRRVTNELGIAKEIAGGHSGQQEASIVMAIDPAMVRLADAEPGYTGDPDQLPESASSIGYHSITENGAIGDPRGASADKGLRYLEALTEAVSRYFRQELSRDALEGVWDYRTIELSGGGRETLTGSFLFLYGFFVQAAIHDGLPLESQLGQGHTGRYRLSDEGLTLDVDLQIVVDPARSTVDHRDRALHAAGYELANGDLTIRFPSGTVQTMKRAPGGEGPPGAIYEVVGHGQGTRRPARGRFAFAAGRFVYAAVVLPPDDGARPLAHLAGEGTFSDPGSGELVLELRRALDGAPRPRYEKDRRLSAKFVGESELHIEETGVVWYLERIRGRAAP